MQPLPSASHRFIRVALAAACFALSLASRPAGAADMPHGIQRAYMDTTCAPCHDFYRYANGAWIDKATMPPSYTVIGAGREIFDRNTEVLYRVLEETRGKSATETDPTLKKLGAFYGTCMDSERADREGDAPIRPMLKRIAAISTRAQLQAEIAALTLSFHAVPFRFGDEADPKQSSMAIGQIYQGGLGLPDRDYYFKTDSTSAGQRALYVAHVGRMFQLAGESEAQAKADADRVMAFETDLAKPQMTRVEQRDPDARYHKMSVAELTKLAPGMDWMAFFKATGVAGLANPTATLDVSQPEFVKAAAAKVASAPLADWKAYLTWHVLDGSADWLSTAYFNENFSFTSVLTGQRQPLTRWKRCSQVTDRALGEALGKAYVASAFSPEAKARALEMVNNLQAALGDRIDHLQWMSDATKAQAHVKLAAVLKKIGYPDTWRDYSAMKISPDSSFAANAQRAASWFVAWRLSNIGKPVDRMEWGMSPPTVNAYYNPTINEIVFPAGIMQPPQFDPLVDDALNYGGMGMVIGHEMSHGFDDEGRKYDAKGNLKDWWTADDAKQFEARAQKVVDQYNGYVAVDTLHVNGKLTLGENIADLGGVTIAYHAFEKSLEGKPRVNIDGFTPEQRFFLGYAQAWRRKIRPETTRQRTLTDPHSPSEWRVNGPLSNLPEFKQAWGCKTGDDMVRGEDVRAEIW
jgi:putative endopeptidase